MTWIITNDNVLVNLDHISTIEDRYDYIEFTFADDGTHYTQETFGTASRTLEAFEAYIAILKPFKAAKVPKPTWTPKDETNELSEI